MRTGIDIKVKLVSKFRISTVTGRIAGGKVKVLKFKKCYLKALSPYNSDISAALDNVITYTVNVEDTKSIFHNAPDAIKQVIAP